jgi:hypothetical protein
MDLIAILINICCSFLASFIFIYFILFMYRPRIEIWPIIAERVGPNDEGRKSFSFKIRNKSWFKSFDINIQLFQVISYPTNDGYRNSRHLELKMNTPKWSYMSKKKPKLFFSKYTDNYVIFRTFEDLHSIFNDDLKSIQFEITLRHGLTGISAIIVREFVRGSIQEGTFKSGRKIEIVK